MAKASLKKEAKKPDLFMRTILRIVETFRTRLKVVIFIGVGAIILSALLFFYLSFEEKKRDELQWQLSKGATLYREYLLRKDLNSLYESESIFNKIAREKKGKVSEIATLYLAKIKELKGEKKEAEAHLRALIKSSRSEILKELAEDSLKRLH